MTTCTGGGHCEVVSMLVGLMVGDGGDHKSVSGNDDHAISDG